MSETDRYEATLELAGWLIWDKKTKQYVADYGDDEDAAKARVEELNTKRGEK